MIRIGAVTIDVSHPRAFATKINENLADRAAYTAVFNDCFRLDEEVEAFAKDFNLTIYKDLDEMIDNIDIGFVHCCNWDKHLDYIMHFVRKGKPVFVDKPLVGNMNDVRKILELVKNGAQILGTSALRYCDEVTELRQKMVEGGVTPIYAHTTSGIDEFNYAIHAVEHLAGIMASPAVSCKHVASADPRGSVSVSDTFCIKYANGATGVFNAITGKGCRFNTTVITDGSPTIDTSFLVDGTKFYQAMIKRVCDKLDGVGDNLATMEEMVESIKVLLAAKASKLNGGIEVSLDSPLLEEVSYDGYEFEKGYAATARAAYEAAKKKAAEEAANK